jgi:NADH-quinone oxidoreductase subunit K
VSGVPIAWYLALAGALFALGVFGALTRRNAITVFLAIELMLNSVNLALVAYSRQLAESLGAAGGAAAATGQVIVLFVIAVAAAEAAVGLALFIAVYRRRRTIDVDRLNLMRW